MSSGMLAVPFPIDMGQLAPVAAQLQSIPAAGPSMGQSTPLCLLHQCSKHHQYTLLLLHQCSSNSLLLWPFHSNTHKHKQFY
jgi:hypothetical protein